MLLTPFSGPRWQFVNTKHNTQILLPIAFECSNPLGWTLVTVLLLGGGCYLVFGTAYGMHVKKLQVGGWWWWW